MIPAILPSARERGRYLMTFFALVLILAAAVFHATWNLLAKRVGDGGPVFVWLFGICSLLIYAPLAQNVPSHGSSRPQIVSGCNSM